MEKSELVLHFKKHHAFLKAEYERLIATRESGGVDVDGIINSLLSSMDTVNNLLSEVYRHASR